MTSARTTSGTSMRLVRSILAVFLGYLLFALSAVALFQLSGRDPHAVQPLWFETVAVLYGMLFSALGGLLAARMAPSRGTLHAGIVTGIVALGATVSLLAGPGPGATWSQWCALTLMAPCAYLGAIAAPRLRRAG